MTKEQIEEVVRLLEIIIRYGLFKDSFTDFNQKSAQKLLRQLKKALHEAP